MAKRLINGIDFAQMVFAGADTLQSQVEHVNALNVFPVPDGDTGTNMNLTLSLGAKELRNKPSSHIGKAAEVLSRGLLMGARGNSGVILSQLFRGFAKSVAGMESINAEQFAQALQQGVDTAYQAVVKPVEGTILTVSKEAAKQGLSQARRTNDLANLMAEVLKSAKEALARTPELLPILKQVGVVDAGGQGLVFIYQGFVHALSGEEIKSATESATMPSGAIDGVMGSHDEHDKDLLIPVMNLAQEAHRTQGGKSAQSHISTEDIRYGYCTEFLVHLKQGKVPGHGFAEADFRRELQEHGDSLLVVADDQLVKVHVHAEYPGTVMNIAMKYGDLTHMKIENMREQHNQILEQDKRHDGETKTVSTAAALQDEQEVMKEFGVVAVAMGEGIAEIFTSLGVDYVLSGGQTMNPSTEDIVGAIRAVGAKKVFILPNNSNIILAAKQAESLVEEREVTVIPSKTIPQGLAAALAFQATATMDVNAAAMNRAIKRVSSGQVTYAVRDSRMDDLEIKQGDYIGICDKKMVSASADLLDTCQRLLEAMITNEEEIVTIFAGEEADEKVTAKMATYVRQAHPNIEVEIYHGGQPLYYYIFSVE